jgi:hypothetical protein
MIMAGYIFLVKVVELFGFLPNIVNFYGELRTLA